MNVNVYSGEKYQRMADGIIATINKEISERIVAIHPLNYCKAEVIETEHYYALRSYNTIIAYVTKTGGMCYDVLRYVYGYTATSAQHFSKFCKKYGCEYVIRIK